MTTARTRRNKPQQARDILLVLLKDQEAEAAKHKAAYEGAHLRAANTRRAIELLDQAMLPGMEEVIPSTHTVIGRNLIGEIPEPLLRVGPIGASTSDAEAIVLDIPEAINTLPPPTPRPRRQRIGEKSQGINDVWSDKDPPGTTVHTPLMYARQDLCEWCKAGVPFATEKRTEHYGDIRYADGKGRPVMNELCTGVKKRVFDVATKDFGKGEA